MNCGVKNKSKTTEISPLPDHEHSGSSGFHCGVHMRTYVYIRMYTQCGAGIAQSV